MTRRPPAASPDWAYFLDFDGTLVDIAATPDAVEVAASLRSTLADLFRATGGATAVVSGRPAAEIEAFLAPTRLAVAGLHGAERRSRPEGPLERSATARPFAAALLAELAALPRQHPGVIVEDKGLATALHYRGAPAAEAACVALAERCVAEDPAYWHLLQGKSVVEIKPRRIDKGDAVRRFAAQPPFAGRRPVFVGDDVTDEDGFAAALQAGGLAVAIGPPPAGRPTAATFRLADPRALLLWLAGAIITAGTPASGIG